MNEHEKVILSTLDTNTFYAVCNVHCLMCGLGGNCGLGIEFQLINQSIKSYWWIVEYALPLFYYISISGLCVRSCVWCRSTKTLTLFSGVTIKLIAQSEAQSCYKVFNSFLNRGSRCYNFFTVLMANVIKQAKLGNRSYLRLKSC